MQGRMTEFGWPGARQRLVAILAEGQLRIGTRDGSRLSPAARALAEQVEGRYVSVASAERALRGSGVHEADSVLWREAPPGLLA